MSHHVTTTGRAYIECDNPRADDVTKRCGCRSAYALNWLDLPIGWWTTPFPAGYDHGLTRRMVDGAERPPAPAHIGLVGDLNTCPKCAAGMRR